MNHFKLAFISVVLFLLTGSVFCAEVKEIRCDRDFKYHLQGFDADNDAIYWSFTDTLCKTDKSGRTLQCIDVPSHHGDCCIHDGKLYISVDREFAGSKTEKFFVYVYQCSDLSFIERIPMKTNFGIDGIVFVNGFFYIAEGKPKDDSRAYNILYKYSPDLKKNLETFYVPGKTTYGVQAMTFSGNCFWLGTYGLGTILTDRQFNVIETNLPDGSVGIYPLPASAKGETRLMIARHLKNDKGRCTAIAKPYVYRDNKLVPE